MYNLEEIDLKWQCHLQAIENTIKQQISSGIARLVQELIHQRILRDVSQFRLNEFRTDAKEYISRRFSHLEAILNQEIFFRPKMVLLDIFVSKKHHQMQEKSDLIAQQCMTLSLQLNAAAIDRSEIIYKEKLKQSTIKRSNLCLQKAQSSTIDKRVRNILALIRSDNVKAKQSKALLIKQFGIHGRPSSGEKSEANPQDYD